MSFESRKFFRSTRSRKIVELATSKISYKDESTGKSTRLPNY